MALRAFNKLRERQKHTFRKPAGPIEPPTPRTSLLGLDRLAREKRAAAAQEGHDNKKPRLDDDGPHFKGMSYRLVTLDYILIVVLSI